MRPSTGEKAGFPNPTRQKSGLGNVPMIPGMSIAKVRREEDKRLRRESIIDAAEALLAERTWGELNFSDLAKDLDLSRSLIYVYFPTKADLFHALCDRGAVALRELFMKALSRDCTGIEQVETIGRAYHRFSREYPIYFKLHSEQSSKTEGESAHPGPQAGDYAHPAFQLLSHALEKGLADGSIRKEYVGDVKLMALSLWSFTLGLLTVLSQKEDFLNTRMMIDSQTLLDHGFSVMRRMLGCGG